MEIGQVEEHKITAKIFSLKDGYEEYENVSGIKIVSKDYNILIMEDYMPVIGEVEGTVYIISETSAVEFKNISAFYKHSHNEFELLIREFNDVQ